LKLLEFGNGEGAKAMKLQAKVDATNEVTITTTYALDLLRGALNEAMEEYESGDSLDKVLSRVTDVLRFSPVTRVDQERIDRWMTLARQPEGTTRPMPFTDVNA
jgi:hypothetical protein